MRLIDADALREYWLENGLNERAYGANDFLRLIDDAPVVEAYTREEIKAAMEDRRRVCRNGDCVVCEYKTTGCFTDFTVISKFLSVYRKRKEAGK